MAGGDVKGFDLTHIAPDTIFVTAGAHADPTDNLLVQLRHPYARFSQLKRAPPVGFPTSQGCVQ